MIRTLHTYLSRELAKVTLLALVAFTLVMTIFAIIEPLRKRGLAGDQVLSLFAYTLPVMLSLTMPIAALFAATIVYGRFAQDNEMLACRASGIGTLSILKPALALGIIVTAASLVLSNFVTPQMARLAELAIKANARGIVYQEISTQGYFRAGTNLIHADRVDIEHDTLYGVVWCSYKYAPAPKEAKVSKGLTGAAGTKPATAAQGGATSAPARTAEAQIVAAAAAQVAFDEYEGDAYATVTLIDPFGMRTSNFGIASESYQRPLQSFQLPRFAKDKAAFYKWGELWGVLADPFKHREISRQIENVRWSIGQYGFAEQLTDAIKDTHVYDKLGDRHDAYVIRATFADVKAGSRGAGGSRPIIVALSNHDGAARDVEVQVLRDGKVRQTISARTCTVEISWSAPLKRSVVSIVMKDRQGVIARDAGDTEGRRLDEWTAPNMPIPADEKFDPQTVSLREIYTDADRYTKSPEILRDVQDIRTTLTSRILGDITAELNGRMAYGVSCVLLVAMGAALGLIYRGGQIVSAFAICVVPATFVIVMVVMGKELISNPEVQNKPYGMLLGLSAIWSGIVALFIANSVIYAKLMRR